MLKYILIMVLLVTAFFGGRIYEAAKGVMERGARDFLMAEIVIQNANEALVSEGYGIRFRITEKGAVSLVHPIVEKNEIAIEYR